MERQDALLWWHVRQVAKSNPREGDRLCTVFGVMLPPKVRRRGVDGMVERLGREVANPERRERARLLCRAALAPMVRRALGQPVEDLLMPDIPHAVAVWPDIEWAMTDAGQGEFFGRALAGVPEEMRQRYAELTAAIEAAADEAEEQWRQRRDAGAAAVSGAARLRAEAARAWAVAGEARREAEDAAAEVAVCATAVRVAARARAAAERRAADLAARLAEREAQIGAMKAAERRRRRPAGREGSGAGPAQAAPLSGRRVLVVGDAPHAAAYRACALALGAREVAFIEGMDLAPGGRLAALVSGADVVALVAAHVRHGTVEMVRGRVRGGARLVLVSVAGMRAFREALSAAEAS